MTLELLKFNTVKDAFDSTANPDLEQRLNPFTFAQNMDARIETPLLEDGTDLWARWLDSRTMQLYGGRSQKYDNRHVFKIDHELDLGIIISRKVESNGAISIDEKAYNSSAGTAFVVIKKEYIENAKCDFAIRADKYEKVKEQLTKGMNADALMQAGGFKVNQNLMPDEVISYNKSIAADNLTFKDVSYANDGWLELAVGKNKAAEQDYQSAIVRLAKYTNKAKEMNCFNYNGKGMGVYIHAENENFDVRPWCIGDFCYRSGADDRGNFGGGGLFLRVRLGKVGEADAPKNTEYDKIDSAYAVILGDPKKALERMTPEIAPGLFNLVNSYMHNLSQKLILKIPR